jgi:hypothetical protein
MARPPTARWLGVLLGAASCCRAPPASQFPSADAALARMRASYACSRAIQGDAALDYSGPEGRMRGKMMYLGALPEQLRLDLYSPFGVTLSTLTSDGQRFSLLDLRGKEFLEGPANTCNVARFTRVPVPPFALVELLRGEAPVLAHESTGTELKWECDRYRLRIKSQYQAVETIELVPRPSDWDRTFSEQRVRVLAVQVDQYGSPLYRAELRDHAPARMAPAPAGEVGSGPTTSPSGPSCDAEVPRGLRLTVPTGDAVLILRSHELMQNPALDPGVFHQPVPAGVGRRHADCQ